MNKCQVTATSLDEAGHGVGLAEGIRVHVVDLLPGERAEVAIDHASPHKPEAWGRIVRRLGAQSPVRVTPACPGFGHCGGCVWQHLSYPAQLEAKRARVIAALGEGAQVSDVRPSPLLFGYRNKGKYVAARSGEHVLLGAYAPRSHHVIDTLGCRVVAPIIDEVATWVRGAAEQAQLMPYEEMTRAGELRYVVVREAGGDVMIALIVAPGTPRAKLEQVANALAKHPAARGLVAITNDRRDGAIVPSGSSAQVLFGHGYLVEELAGVKLEVGASEFVQVNRAQAHAMYTRVAELAGDMRGKRAVDLFAGLGGFGLYLARAGAEVIAVEIDRDAVSQLRRAAERAGLPLTTIAGDANAELAPQLGTPDLVVVNPPRKGLSETTRELLATLAPPTILYISCGPDSLGRDLAALRVQGFIPDAVEPFDLMPGTAQVETIVRLRRYSLHRRRFGLTGGTMSFRDDHDAALARIDALEGEIARARDSEGDALRELAAERAARRRLEAQLRGGAQPGPQAPPEQPAVRAEDGPIGPYAVLMACVVAFFLAGFFGMAILN